jgi:hypothetical protein
MERVSHSQCQFIALGMELESWCQAMVWYRREQMDRYSKAPPIRHTHQQAANLRLLSPCRLRDTITPNCNTSLPVLPLRNNSIANVKQPKQLAFVGRPIA